LVGKASYFPGMLVTGQNSTVVSCVAADRRSKSKV
jgi:hypothetical protein